MRARIAVATVLLALATAGCNLPNNAAADAGTCDDAGQKVGDQCLTVWEEFCKQLSRCDVSATDTCAMTYEQANCCVGTTCDAWSCQAPEQVSLCTTDIDNESCNDVANGTIVGADNGNAASDCAPFVTTMSMAQ
jgi:hypothetical protein